MVAKEGKTVLPALLAVGDVALLRPRPNDTARWMVVDSIEEQGVVYRVVGRMVYGKSRGEVVDTTVSRVVAVAVKHPDDARHLLAVLNSRT
jgi:hypothetical protein